MADGRTWQDKAMRCDAMQGWLEDDTFLMQQKMPSVNLNSRTTERDGDFSGGGGYPKKTKMCHGHHAIAFALAVSARPAT